MVTVAVDVIVSDANIVIEAKILGVVVIDPVIQELADGLKVPEAVPFEDTVVDPE